MSLFGLGCIFALAIWLGSSLRRNILSVVTPMVTFCLGMAIAFLLFKGALVARWHTILLSVFVGIVIGYFFTWLLNVRLDKSAVLNGFRIASRLIFGDFRVAAVLIGLLLSYILTFHFALLAKEEAPPAFWAAFYPAWVSGLLFFTVVGLIAGLVTLYRPERDVFAARVKILLGGKTGPAVDFIASELRRIGYVARSTRRVITVEGYDATMQAFRVKVWHCSTIRNIYDDIPTNASGTISITPDPLDPPPTPYGQITSFLINGVGQGSIPQDIQVDGLRRGWTLPIPAGGESSVEYEHWYWYKVTEEHKFTLARFTEDLSVEFHCRCSPMNKKLVLKLTTSDNNIDETLGWDGRYQLRSLKDQSPATSPYKFKLAVGS